MNLTKEELETPRTARDYLGWVKRRIAHAGTCDMRGIRLRQGLSKHLLEEALPIGYFAKRHFLSSEDVKISLIIGNQGYDAVVEDSRLPVPATLYIEVTLANEDYETHLRRELLHEAGLSHRFGPIWRQDKSVAQQPCLASQAEVIEFEFRAFTKAISRKLSIQYPEPTVLVVGFDDIMSFDRQDNLSNIEHAVRQSLPAPPPFIGVAVVGLVQNTFIWIGSDVQPNPRA